MNFNKIVNLLYSTRNTNFTINDVYFSLCQAGDEYTIHISKKTNYRLNIYPGPTHYPRIGRIHVGKYYLKVYDFNGEHVFDAYDKAVEYMFKNEHIKQYKKLIDVFIKDMHQRYITVKKEYLELEGLKMYSEINCDVVKIENKL